MTSDEYKGATIPWEMHELNMKAYSDPVRCRQYGCPSKVRDVTISEYNTKIREYMKYCKWESGVSIDLCADIDKAREYLKATRRAVRYENKFWTSLVGLSILSL
jgi:hypothetical protein